ncbi:LysR family transcriptional regulator [Paraburkholderia rhizosphaerae]|uniref:LysR family transcriptional regulator n=1 Tax=Paraburkholderia rhizosphaerae TaxID=480658 RepID=A0A4R8LJS4_9BURK|nr:LysR family transcriptional regulator [Paraburkholderia rhizosphaerae]TDY43276.1 LysR family transcriptional regulator [Paraburkholderia rhizosphaerae]
MSIELGDMRFFVEALRQGSLTKAALQLDIPKSSGSRRIKKMEEELGVQLLKRNTRKLYPTEIGKAYFERCARVIDEIAAAEQMVSEQRRSPGGPLRIAVPSELGALRYAAWFTEFISLHPDITMEIHAGAGSRLVELIASDVDVWIKTGDVQDSGLVVRRLCVLKRSVYASPAYLEQRRFPEHPHDLNAHNCLMLGDQPNSSERWSFSRDSEQLTLDVSGNVWVNSLAILRQLTLSGLGLALLPDVQVEDDVNRHALVKTMSDWIPEGIEVNLLMPHRALLPARIRAFVDFFTTKPHE